jgi:NAD(P)-dependent dehydrogenase (short-subunit alcohol dehydrogenase family)
MDYLLRNKKALVTGSTSGIGFAIASLLAQEGATVIINGRTNASVEKAIKQIKDENPSTAVTGFAADFTDKKSVDLLLAEIREVDILVNNVGIFTSQSFENTRDQDWYRLFEVNVMSGVRLARQLMPAMHANGWGRIIFISSECAQLVPEDLIAYSMTKSAIITVARGLANTTKGTQVTVNTVMPGSTLSEGAERFLADQALKENRTKEEVSNDFFKNVRTTSLLGRFAQPKEVANAVVYLASPLSSATNGSVVKVEGGST